MTHYEPATARTTRLAGLTTWDKARTVLCGPTVRRQSNVRTPSEVGLAFETKTFPGSGGAKLEAWHLPGKRAGAPCIVLFPGYAASKDTLLHAAREFGALGCEQWLVDPHGIGGSEGNVTSVGYHEAEDVAAAFAEAKRSAAGRPVILYGTSMGAVACMRAVHQKWADPAGLILECPFDRFTTTIGNRFERLGLPRFPLATGVAFWVGVQQGFNGFAHNPTAYAAGIQCPVLLMQGGHDESVGRESLLAVNQAFGSRCQFVFIPDGGHAFLVLHSAPVWRRSVREFLSGRFRAVEG